MVKYKIGGSFDESMTAAPLLRSNFASNFKGPRGVEAKCPFCSMLSRFLVCADPAMAIARSKAICPLIAVAIVRRKNLKSLNTNFFFGTLVSESDVVETVDGRSTDDPCLLTSVELAACDFLRRRGHTGSLSSDDGAGGNGEELISPIRSRVKVSCAFVGTPAKSVL